LIVHMSGGEHIEYMTENELVIEYRRLYPDDRGLALLTNGHLRSTWNSSGLFGEIGSHKAVNERRPGRTTLYRPDAIARLRYVLAGDIAGVGAERIKRALELGIQREVLALLPSARTFRYVLTKPLALLLRSKRPERLSAQAVHRRLWEWRRTDVDRVLQRFVKKHPDQDPEELLEWHPRARNVVPLSYYLEAPRVPEDYLQDLRQMPSNDLASLLTAMRRVVDIVPSAAPPEQRSADLEVISHHVVREYSIEYKEHPDKDGQRALHVYTVNATRRRLTLLQHTCSHLYAIREQPQDWIQRCHRCDHFFAVSDPDQETCQQSGCRGLQPDRGNTPLP